MLQQSCSEMVQLIRVKFFRLLTWQSYGIYLLCSFVKTTSTVWEPLSRDHQWILTFSQEEIKSLASELTETTSLKWEKQWNSLKSIVSRKAPSSLSLWPIVMPGTQCLTQEQPTELEMKFKTEEKQLILSLKWQKSVLRTNWLPRTS